MSIRGVGTMHIENHTPQYLTQIQIYEVFYEARRELIDDYKTGRVPFDVLNLSECHDYVDGNMYGYDSIQRFEPSYDEAGNVIGSRGRIEYGNHVDAIDADLAESNWQRYISDINIMFDALNHYITSGEARRDFEAWAGCSHSFSLDFEPWSETHTHWQGRGDQELDAKMIDQIASLVRVPCTCSKCIHCGAVTVDPEIYSKALIEFMESA
jgi:hypothetical protein